MKIALTIPTGRSRIKQVIKAFIQNAISHKHDPKNFSIYLSIDTTYQNTKPEDFKLDPEIEKRVKKVNYIFEDKRNKLVKQITEKCNVKKEIIEQLFAGNGYSKQRNAALWFAMEDNNDIAICFDDDEAPDIPIKKKNNKIQWKNLDFFSPHMEALSSGADITRGQCLGYLSPIPSDFEKDIPEKIRKKLGEALQWGSDVITKHSFFNLMSQIKYLPESELTNPTRPFTVEQGQNGKHIYGGNMGINLHSVRAGKIPIFYTPPKARGEDTIFALQLQNVTVKEVNSFIFHDPFDMYPDILKRKFPEELRAIPVTNETKTRFVNALIGWLKYAPILISITAKDENEKSQRINEMLNKIDEPTHQLADVLEYTQIKECHTILKKYNEEVEKHLNELSEIQKTWKEDIIGPYFNNPLPAH